MDRVDPDAFLDHDNAATLKKGPWTSAEDGILISYVQKHGEGNWNAVQKHSGLSRCGKSCRLRWANHLRPNLKKGAFTQEEERMIIELHQKLGNKWARMAAQLPGRTDNEIKNYWNTRIKRRMRAGLPVYPSDTQAQPSTGHQHAHADKTGAREMNNDNMVARSNTRKVVSKSNTEIQGLNLVNIGGSCHLRLSNCSSLPSLSCAELPYNNSIMENTVRRGKRGRDETNNKSNLQPYLKTRKTYVQDILPIPRQGFPFERECIPQVGVPHFEGLTNGNHTLVSIPHQPLIFRPEAQGLKLELPSSQSAESAGSTGTPRSAVSSPYTVSNPPNHLLSEADSFNGVNGNSFLEALLQEAQIAEGNDHAHSELVDQILLLTSNNSSLDINTILINSEKHQWSKIGPLTPLGGHSALSVFGEEPQQHWEVPTIFQPHTNGNCVKLEANTCIEMPVVTYTDEELSTLLDFAKLDAAPVPEWYIPNVAYAAADGIPVSVPSFDLQDAAIDLDQLLSGQVAMNQIWELGSCPWINMPGACHIGDVAAECRALPNIAEPYNDSCAIY